MISLNWIARNDIQENSNIRRENYLLTEMNKLQLMRQSYAWRRADQKRGDPFLVISPEDKIYISKYIKLCISKEGQIVFL